MDIVVGSLLGFMAIALGLGIIDANMKNIEKHKNFKSAILLIALALAAKFFKMPEPMTFGDHFFKWALIIAGLVILNQLCIVSTKILKWVLYIAIGYIVFRIAAKMKVGERMKKTLLDFTTNLFNVKKETN